VPESSPVVELLAALAAVLRRHGVRWYLFGAQAVAIWGRPRMSADVDVTAAVDAAKVQAVIQSLEDEGFELRIRTDVEEFVARTRVLPFLHVTTRLPLDLVLAGPGLEQEFLDRAQTIDVAGLLVPVLAPEDLVITKVLAGRPKDLEDVAGVLRERRTSLDLERIRHTLAMLEQALGQSDLVPAFEDQLARV
jgi:hypothetical protein